MHRTLTIGMVLWFAMACASHGGAEPPRFTAPPRVEKIAGGWRVTFTLSAATDVEVSVLDAKGNVVRHLAAGLLGGKFAPPAPLTQSLSQQLVWDGKDDLGQDVATTGCKFRARLGMKATLGKILMNERGLPFAPRAATVGPDGLVYVLSEHAQVKSTFLLEAYTQAGEYVRTVMPYPADLPEDRLRGLPRLVMPDGRRLPMIGHAGFRDLYPGSTGMRPQRMLITSKGRIVLTNASRTHGAGVRIPQRLLVVDTDGGTPTDNYRGPLTSSENFPYGLCWLALSPDEKWIYTSGHLKDGGGEDNFNTAPHQVVYRVGWQDRGFARPLLGTLLEAGADQSHFNDPRGIDTDAQGRIYVCDYGNDRVAVFDAQGKWCGRIDVPSPDQVAVDKPSGAVYVLSWRPARDKWRSTQRLLKFPGIGQAAVADRDIGLPYSTMSVGSEGDRSVFSVNDSSEVHSRRAEKRTSPRPVIWLARTFWEAPEARRGIERVVDLGDRLSEPVEVIRHRAMPDVYHLGASMASDDLFVHSYSEHQLVRVDGRSGTVKRLPDIRGEDVAVGPQGQLVTLRMTRFSPGLKNVEQYDRDGVALPFAALGSNVIRDVPGNTYGHCTTASRGLYVSPRGDIAVLDEDSKGRGVSIYGLDGRIKRRRAIDGLAYCDGSPVIDLAGNLYIAAAAKPPAETMPAPFDPRQPPSPYYPWMYGSVIKFSARGGRLYYKWPELPAGAWPPAGADRMLALVSNFPGVDVLADGAAWSRGGFTVVPAASATVIGCGCYTSRFGVDWFGRVYIPDVGQFRVAVVDGANNPLVRFGDYGNADSEGPGSRVPRPAIPLAWPYAVSIGRSGVYVSDFINRRIVRVDLEFAVTECCEVK